MLKANVFPSRCRTVVTTLQQYHFQMLPTRCVDLANLNHRNYFFQRYNKITEILPKDVKATR